MTSDPRVRRIRILILLGVLALAGVVIAVALSGGGDDGGAGKRRQAAKQVSGLDGIPQSGLTLGNPAAPAELEEFIDLQCPFCAQFSTQALPTVVQDYVRDGRLKLTLRPLAFIGKDSLTGARALLAAAEQDEAFAFASAFYASQGPENSGYVTEPYLRKVSGSVEGLKTIRVIAETKTNESFAAALKRITARARALGVSGSPTFVLTREGQPPVTLKVDPGDYRSSISQALGDALAR